MPLGGGGISSFAGRPCGRREEAEEAAEPRDAEEELQADEDPGADVELDVPEKPYDADREQTARDALAARSGQADSRRRRRHPGLVDLRTLGLVDLLFRFFP